MWRAFRLSEDEKTRAAGKREEALRRDEQNDRGTIRAISSGGTPIGVFNGYCATRKRIVAKFEGEAGWTPKDLDRYLKADVSKRLRPKFREIAFKTGRMLLLVCCCGGCLSVVQLYRMHNSVPAKPAALPSSQPIPLDPFSSRNP
ncbi:MAG: hypothetical protein AAF802_08470 [Planctomycetota bacterium]